MSSSDIARERAAKLLKKKGSISSQGTTTDYLNSSRKQERSISTVSHSYVDGNNDLNFKPPVKLENTYQLGPKKLFPVGQVKQIISDVLQSYLLHEKYEPELCKNMTKTMCEVIKARVKEIQLPRYKIICLVNIGEMKNQGIETSSRCLWNAESDTFVCYEFSNGSIFAEASVYGIYYE